MGLGRIFCGIGKALGGCQELKPVPNSISPSGLITLDEMSSIILDKLEAMNDEKTEIYLPDAECKVYNKEAVKAFLSLNEVSKIIYVPEEQDCDDFAAQLFGIFAGLVWTRIHALNFFVDTESKLWFIEPQTDLISENLEGGQGAYIRFLLGR